MAAIDVLDALSRLRSQTEDIVDIEEKLLAEQHDVTAALAAAFAEEETLTEQSCVLKERHEDLLLRYQSPTETDHLEHQDIANRALLSITMRADEERSRKFIKERSGPFRAGVQNFRRNLRVELDKQKSMMLALQTHMIESAQLSTQNEKLALALDAANDACAESRTARKHQESKLKAAKKSLRILQDRRTGAEENVKTLEDEIQELKSSVDENCAFSKSYRDQNKKLRYGE